MSQRIEFVRGFHLANALVPSTIGTESVAVPLVPRGVCRAERDPTLVRGKAFRVTVDLLEHLAQGRVGLTERSLVAANADVAITAGYIIVDGGRLEIGTATTPFTCRAVVTLTGTTTAAPTPALAHFGNKVLAVQGRAVSLHGREVGTAWTRLAADVTAGAGSITLADAPRWRIGDRLVVATSTRQMNQTEVVEIAAINGSTVTIARPLQFSQVGTVRRAGDVSVDVRAEVGLLTHNIVVQGDEQSESLRIGGHAMFMIGATPATVQLARVTFRRMGQFNLTGRYPVHFHLMDAMRDSYVRQVAIDGSIQLGIVLHAVSGVQATGQRDLQHRRPHFRGARCGND